MLFLPYEPSHECFKLLKKLLYVKLEKLLEILLFELAAVISSVNFDAEILMYSNSEWFQITIIIRSENVGS